MSHLSQRPDVPADVLEVGRAIPHESAALHVTGAALYTDDLVARTKDCLHAWPVQAPMARASIIRLDVAPAYDVPGVVRVLTADDVPGVNDAGVKHDEPLFPDEVRFFGHAVCWVLGETQEAARLGAEAVELDLEPLPSIITVREAIAAHEFQGAQPTVSRGDLGAGLEARPTSSAASSSSPARSTSTSRPTARWPTSTRPGRSSSRAAPSTPRRPRRSWPTCSGCTPPRSPCSACGWVVASAARRCSRTASPRSPRWAPR